LRRQYQRRGILTYQNILYITLQDIVHTNVAVENVITKVEFITGCKKEAFINLQVSKSYCLTHHLTARSAQEMLFSILISQAQHKIERRRANRKK